jgi:hypothetical protein
MTEPLFALAILAAFVAAMAAVHFFKTLDSDLWHAWRISLAAGLVAGVVLRLARTTNPLAAGILLTIGALYARHTGRESESVDGMLLGGVMGALAALPLLDPRAAASLILAGAVAGYGITFAASHVAARGKQILLDLLTAAAAVATAWLPLRAFGGLRPATPLFVVTIALPLLVVAAVFRQWPDIRAELRHEASLGFIDDADVRRTAHPLLRLGSGGWADRRAHRELVRLANEIALRKRRQRGRPDEIARLYQLEIIKLRMQIQEMSLIDRDVRRRAAEGERPSDTIPGTRHEA